MIRESAGGQRRMVDVIGVGGGDTDIPQSAIGVDPVGRKRRRRRADSSARREAEPRSHDSSSPPDYLRSRPSARVLG